MKNLLVGAVVLMVCVVTISAFADVDPSVQTADQNRKITVGLLVKGSFDEAVGFLDTWEKTKPEDKAKIDLLREVESKVKAEPDEQKRKELIATISMEQVNRLLGDFSTKMQAMKDEGLMGPNNTKQEKVK